MIVLMKLRFVVGRDFDVIGANVFILDFQMMVRFAGHTSVRQRDRLRRLRIEREGRD